VAFIRHSSFVNRQSSIVTSSEGRWLSRYVPQEPEDKRLYQSERFLTDPAGLPSLEFKL
jgi:hypothetical protein